MEDGALNGRDADVLTYDIECMKTIEISLMQTLGAHIDVISSPTALGFATRSTPCVAAWAKAPAPGLVHLAFSTSPIAAAAPFNSVRYPTHEGVLGLLRREVCALAPSTYPEP